MLWSWLRTVAEAQPEFQKLGTMSKLNVCLLQSVDQKFGFLYDHVFWTHHAQFIDKFVVDQNAQFYKMCLPEIVVLIVKRCKTAKHKRVIRPLINIYLLTLFKSSKNPVTTSLSGKRYLISIWSSLMSVESIRSPRASSHNVLIALEQLYGEIKVRRIIGS